MSSTNDAHQVLRQFRVIFNAVKTHFQQVEKAAGIGGAQVWALSILAEEPGIRVGALAKRMDIHQSTASNMVRALVDQELVLMQRDALDKRAYGLSLSPAGQVVLDKAPAPLAGVLPQALESLDALTLQRLNTDLDRIIYQLGQHANDKAAGIPLSEL